ncbi:hypothetical protein E2C01_028237 [Portunus trituberculatus]|uniref:Uncharacterized protein n=1 Tax=Portunus trituberculatus TaxID=210409 RepID=A0A5B7ER31_PORTR|nr:hypothetical protein [Portunus trituberculatus]
MSPRTSYLLNYHDNICIANLYRLHVLYGDANGRQERSSSQPTLKSWNKVGGLSTAASQFATEVRDGAAWLKARIRAAGRG